MCMAKSFPTDMESIIMINIPSPSVEPLTEGRFFLVLDPYSYVSSVSAVTLPTGINSMLSWLSSERKYLS